MRGLDVPGLIHFLHCGHRVHGRLWPTALHLLCQCCKLSLALACRASLDGLMRRNVAALVRHSYLPPAIGDCLGYGKTS